MDLIMSYPICEFISFKLTLLQLLNLLRFFCFYSLQLINVEVLM
jgi:hypothetical protein